MRVATSDLRSYLETSHGMVVGEATLTSLHEQLRHQASFKVTVHGRSLKTGRKVDRVIRVARLTQWDNRAVTRL